MGSESLPQTSTARCMFPLRRWTPPPPYSWNMHLDDPKLHHRTGGSSRTAVPQVTGMPENTSLHAELSLVSLLK